ncbi:hypothetical protein [Aeromonas veronii]|uniref:hypothetical protein n=1 Tax=Aeromonas veronii TaxID=654 RepID=UPI003D198336
MTLKIKSVLFLFIAINLARFPPLVFFPQSYIIPLATLAILSFFYICIKMKLMWNIEIAIVCISYIVFIFNSGGANFELNRSVVLIYSFLVVFLLGGKVFRNVTCSTYVDNSFSFFTSNVIVLFFLVAPLSVLIQFIYPDIFNLYQKIIIYPPEFIRQNEIGGRYSGLLDATGTGGSVIFSCLFLMCFIYLYAQGLLTRKIYHMPYAAVLMICLFASFLTGFTGNIIVLLFLFFLMFFFSENKFYFLLLKSPIVLSFSLIAMILLSLNFESKALSYINVLYTNGFDAFLNKDSMKVLLSFYESAETNLNLAVGLGGWLGNSNAKSTFQLTDIGYINIINLYGMVGLINFYMTIFLLMSINIYQCLKLKVGDGTSVVLVVNCAIISLCGSLFLIQLKEFVYFSNSMYIIICFFIVLKANVFSKLKPS